MEKFQIFEQVRGPAFLEKFNFFTVLKKHFYSPEGLSFYLEYQQKIFPRFFFSKKQRMKKIRIFKENRGLTPLEKFRFSLF